MISCNLCIAQVTIISDTNFRNFLNEKYPQLLDSNKALINAKAAQTIGNFNCSKRNIVNLSGIERFTKISGLFCNDNNITNLDSVKNLKQLKLIDCHNNPLGRLPKLDSLINLDYLWCSGCKLTELPDLSNNLLLKTLNCYSNQLIEIKGLEKLVNLGFLNCFDNKIVALPDISNLKQLVLLQCFSNDLKDIPGLSALTELHTIIAGDNQLTSFPDLSLLTKLKVLKLYSNELTISPDVSNCPLLETFEISFNPIDHVQDFKNNLNLKQLLIENNKLKELPNLNHLVRLNRLRCANNQLRFKDLIPLVELDSLTSFSYTPQANPIGNKVITTRELRTVKISNQLNEDGLGNQYSWTKDNQAFANTNQDSLIFNRILKSQAGIYQAQITNSKLPNLIIKGDTFNLKVIDCFDTDAFNPKTTEYQCSIGASISYDLNSIIDGTPPFDVSLQGKVSQKTITPFNSTFPRLHESNYQMNLKDALGCTYSKDITIPGKKAEDCNILVIAYEGNQSNYINFEETGLAKVFNTSGKLIHSFSTPNQWNGTQADGQVIPGYYILVLNDKSYEVTIIK